VFYTVVMASDSRDKGAASTTARPVFDPQAFAHESEMALKAATSAEPESSRATVKFSSPPPLNKRVRMRISSADVAWFELSSAAQMLAERLDGTRTLFDVMQEGPTMAQSLNAVAELHDHDLLVFEE